MRALFIVMFVLLGIRPAQATEIREAVRGEVDLSTWSGANGLRIYGDWLFFPNKLLSPQEALANLNSPNSKPQFLKVGRPFREFSGEALQNLGFGTYLLQVKNPCQNCRIYFAQPQVYVAGKIFVFDSLHSPSALPLFELGQVATRAADEAPQPGSFLTPSFELHDQKEFYVLVQASNFHYYWGGLWQPPAMYINESSLPMTEIVSAVFLFGAMLFSGIYSLSLFLRRREDQATKELCIFSMIMLLRSASFAFLWRLTLLRSNFIWEALWDITFITLILAIAAFYRFLCACFPEHSSPVLKRLLGIISLCFVAIFAFTPMIDSEYLIAVVYGYTFICLLACFWVLAHAVKARQEGALISLLGVLALSLSALTSLLWIFGNTSFSGMGVEIGTAIFMICQTQIVAKRSASAFRRAEQLSKELVEKDRARTLFFHNTSHELRTPLHGILGFLHLITKGRYGPINDRVKQQINKAIRLTESLKDQVNTILDLAKSKRGELTLQVQSFPVSDMLIRLQDFTEGLRLKYPQVQFVLQNKLNAEQSFIQDVEKILTVIRNVLSNAFKFTRVDAANHVNMLLQTSAEGLFISISDTGIGIRSDKIPKIFEEFAQLQADARRSFEGTGLGLSIVHDLLELMQGRIEVQSQEGKGSVFKIWIPELSKAQMSVVMPVPSNLVPAVEEEQEPENSDSLPMSPSPVQLAQPSRFLILVIDDNELNCEVVQDLLQMDGYRVMIATGGREGISRIESLQPHLVLLDLMMPDVSGEDVMRHLKSQERLKEIPVILITARATEEDKIMGLDLGADDYLAKPLVPDELRLRVRNILARYDNSRSVATQEYQDKMSQLGEVIADLGHEMQRIYQTIDQSHLDPASRIQKVGQLLPLPVMQRDLLVRMVTLPSDQQTGSRQAFHLPVPSPDHPAVLELRVLYRILSELPLPADVAKNLWRNIGQLSLDQIRQLSESMLLFEGYLQLNEAAVRSRDLMECILGFSRQDLRDHQVDLNALVSSTLLLVKLRARRHQIEIQSHLNPISLYTVASSLQQIMLSLLNNAVDALAKSNADPRWIRVSVSEAKDEWISIEISNSGERIANDVATHLFESGFTTKGPQGNGIGLFISRRLARQLHGDLFYDSEAAFTTFTLKLPLSQADRQKLAS